MRHLGDPLSRRIARPLGWYLPRGRISYLLRDEFTTDVAAGSVNGTAAEPGPGTRVVTDTNNKLSISSSQLSFATGGVAGGDPGLWYGAVTRTAGRIMLGKATITTNDMYIGFDQNTAGTPDNSNAFRLRQATSTVTAFDSSVTITIGALTPGSEYDFALILRATGAYYYIKGNAYTNWTLLWVSSLRSDDPIYPCVVANAATTVGSADNVRIPDVIYLPTPVAYDTFTRANGALGNSETSGPDSQTVTARTWNNRVGTTQVASNAASASALSGGIAIATVDTGTADVLCSSALTRTGNEIGIVVRYADSNNYVRAYHDGANAKLDKVVGGAVTNVISAAQAYAAGATIRVICEGTSFSLHYNNVKIGSTSTIADAALQNGTEQGTYSSNTGNSQDNMTVFPRGSGDEYSQLDNY